MWESLKFQIVLDLGFVQITWGKNYSYLLIEYISWKAGCGNGVTDERLRRVIGVAESSDLVASEAFVK